MSANFDILAPHYDRMEFFLAGEKLQRCRMAFLAETRSAENALLAGEGHGRFLEKLLAFNPRIEITCLEKSSGMIARSKTRLAWRGLSASRVHFIQRDALEWQPEEATYDLIVTHFFLDCFRPEQLALLIPKFARATNSGGRWLLADFCNARGGIARLRTRLILKAMYLFFQYVTRLPAARLTAPDSYLVANGFQLSQRHGSEWGLLHSDLWIRSKPAPTGTSTPTTAPNAQLSLCPV